LQHTAIHSITFNTLDRWRECESVSHCNTLQHTASHGNIPQHTPTHHDTLQHTATHSTGGGNANLSLTATHCKTLQHTAKHCNTLQQTRQVAGMKICLSPQHTASHYNILQHTATHHNTLQHTTPNCNTLERWRECESVRCIHLCQLSFTNGTPSQKSSLSLTWHSQCSSEVAFEKFCPTFLIHRRRRSDLK